MATRTPQQLASLAVVLAIVGCSTIPPGPPVAGLSISLMDDVNVTAAGYREGCGNRTPGLCHPVYPSRREIAAVRRLECTGYVMAKAYALIDAGIAPGRMQVAEFYRADYEKKGHAVLVVDGRFVLDNMTPGVRSLEEYGRFDPVLRAVPWKS